MKYLLLDNENLILYIADKFEDSNKGYVLDDIIFPSKGLFVIAVDYIPEEVVSFEYKYIKGKFRKTSGIIKRLINSFRKGGYR